MRSIGPIRSALQHYNAAHDALVWGEVHALAEKPLNRTELLVAADALRRAQLAILDALATDNVVRPKFNRPAQMGGEAIALMLRDQALLRVPTINADRPRDEPSGAA